MSTSTPTDRRPTSGYLAVLLALVFVVVSLLSLAYPLVTPFVAAILATAGYVMFRRHGSNAFVIAGLICAVVGVAGVVIDLTLLSASTSISEGSPVMPSQQ